MFETARPFLLALAIGLVLGIERERAQARHPGHDPLGSRTFTLLALLGAIAAHVEEPALAAVLGAFAGAVILAGYFRTRLGPDAAGVGLTTEVAGMAVFALGWLAHEQAELAVMLAVLTVAVLSLKDAIHGFAREGLKEQEIRAALTFLVVAFVVLPLLPDREVDPWGLVNPARMWLIFATILGISFGGYIAVRVLGPERGFAGSGLFAGLVSSTAATLALAQRAREGAEVRPVAAGIVLANVASAAAQVLVVAVIAPDLVRAVLPVVGAAVLAGVLGTVGVAWVFGSGGPAEGLSLPSPIALRPSAAFAALIAVVLVASSAALRWFGEAGVLAAATLGGAANVHAATLSVATLARSGGVAAGQAVLAILCGFLANMAVKLGLAGWIGGRRLLAAVAPPLLLMASAAIVAWFVLYGS